MEDEDDDLIEVENTFYEAEGNVYIRSFVYMIFRFLCT